MFSVAKLLYIYKCPSVRQPHLGQINEHLFCKYFVRQSVGQATKGRNIKIKKHDFLDGCLDRDFRSDSCFCEDSSH